MARTIHILQPLVVFPSESGTLDNPKMTPRGQYRVERIPNPRKQDGERWLKIVGEPWANAESCWRAASVDLEKSVGELQPVSPVPLVLVGLICLILMLVRPNHGDPKPTVGDIPILKMELSGLQSQLDNLKNHYPLMSSEAQRRYEMRYSEAIYSLDVYPRYHAMQQLQQREVLARRPDLEMYVATVNALDDELYRAWHDWGLSNRAVVLTGIEQRKRRILSTETMRNQAQAYEPAMMAGVTAANAGPWLELNERLEAEIVDADPSLKEVARQNRECSALRLQLMTRMDLLQAQLVKAEKPEKLVRGKS